MSETISKEQEVTEATKVWQEYLQKCCEVGQLYHARSALDSQGLEIDKQLDVAQQAVKRLARKHHELKQQAVVPAPPAAPEEVKAH